MEINSISCEDCGGVMKNMDKYTIRCEECDTTISMAMADDMDSL